jgi:ATP-dependent HslUV protease ATP-binding subunit HslU
MHKLTPREIVAELDKYIIGQHEAKKAVAIALRNRYRRKLLPPELSEEIYPKNIIMIGSTGVGKTEIARRLAKIVRAPFIKVEASKFTEVGYVGRDVDSMIRDLVQTALRMVREEKMAEVKEQAAHLAEELLVDYLSPLPNRPNQPGKNPWEYLMGHTQNPQEDEDYRRQLHAAERHREIIRQKLARKELEEEIIAIEVEEKNNSFLEIISGAGVEEMGINLQDALGGLLPKSSKNRKLSVEEARPILCGDEANRLIDADEANREAIRRVEEDGLVFLDEIDKIAGKEGSYGPDVSRGGVQRDILPIIEGSTVVTKYGPVKTDHILFIAAGAFHVSKPSDLIPELQGRFPIRVELDSLKKEDLIRILTEPHNSLLKQYTALLSTEKLDLIFADEAIDYIAEIAFEVNARTENIGARRLHTIMEKVLEDLLFEANELQGDQISIDREYVQKRLQHIVADEDLSRYIL